MKILVCVRQGLDGEISPFDACAYEEALKIRGAEVILISMGAPSAKDFLLNLTRLGAKKAILLTDTAFAGADTLATAYTLSMAVKKIDPDLIFCGRQTLVGDTAQTGPMLAVMSGYSLITNVMSVDSIDGKVVCTTREGGVQHSDLPALLTVERINKLRLPSIMSRLGEVEIWNADDISADKSRCGLKGSPTKVLKTFESESGKRKCKFITFEELPQIIQNSMNKQADLIGNNLNSTGKIANVCIVGEAPMSYAAGISDNITVLSITDADNIANRISEINPDAVLWGSDFQSKKLAAQVSAMLGLGLCADCTMLETDSEKLFMYRPALSGSVIAKIVSNTKPAMATVRTVQNSADVIVCAGYGARDYLDKVKKFAESIGAELAATRKAVDNDLLPYSMQVGLTGKKVSPNVYIAVGVSGAVHHIAGMQHSGTVIAVNSDKNAPIFEYADYGIVDSIFDM